MTIDATRAAQVLDRDFSTFDTAAHGGSTDDKISQNDLKAVAENADGKYTAEQQTAAQFLLDSTAVNSAFDVGAGLHDVDGTIGRGDINAIMESINNGTFDQRLLDTASGKGPLDQYASSNDLDAALADPGVPDEVKDAIRLARYGGQDADLNDVLKNLTADGAAKASELYNSSEFNALPASDQALVAQTFRDSNGDPAVAADLQKLIQDPSFQALDAASKTAKLNEVAIQQSPEFKALPASDQKLVTDALAARKPGQTDQPANIASLLKNDDFQGLSADEKTAVLSQVKNYPDQRSVENLERLMAKDWFKDFGLEDKQRTLKAIAFLAQNDAGDAEVNKNTLERVLSPDSDYVFRWDASFRGDINSNGGLYGQADGTNITFNANMVNPGNGPLTETYNSKHVVLHTIAHEVNHNVNGDSVANTYEYLEQEYRAWYTGFKAEFGHPPTNADAMERWRNEITGSYSAYSQAAINGSETEARKFAEEMSLITGNPIPANASHDDLKQFIQDQVDLATTDYADPNGAAPVPPGNKTNE